MRALMCLLLATSCVVADESENRRSKLPYIADAVGNTLPPPSNGPATVGSPVNLLTPDRYEFYTFDESGELVKRLMTLEEIQAIVAAGEETEGLVTFANENQPTIAFNFSQPPYTKVHSVVTNVQNVLKAQMEAHKNKPHIQPTLDTPDVSDSWSLILPSIFGNTGVDIVPDKTSGSFTTPETETIELDHPIDDNSLSKEGSNQILSSSSTSADDNLKEHPVTEKLTSTTEAPKITSSTVTTTTTRRPTTTTTTTTTAKPLSTTTTTKPTTTAKLTTTAKPTTTARLTTSTVKPTSTTSKSTTAKLRTTVTTTTSRPRTTSTTIKPRTTTTVKPTTKIVRTTSIPNTTAKPILTTKKYSSTLKDNEVNFTRIQVQTVPNTASSTEKSTVEYEKISTFIPISTAAYVTERPTQKPIQSTKRPIVSSTKKLVPSTTRLPSTTTSKPQPSITTYKPSISTAAYVALTTNDESEKFNATTITTQSVSPSTTVSSTEFVSIGHLAPSTEKKPTENDENTNNIKQNEPEIPLFDVAQSISQIASDLGGNYRPLPTSSDLLDTTKLNDMNLESKENIEIDIPVEGDKETEMKNADSEEKIVDNFVKISTSEPQRQNENKVVTKNTSPKLETKTTTLVPTPTAEITTNKPTTTTIDPVLSESMEDLLSQVVMAPPSIVNSEKRPNNQNKTINVETTTTTLLKDNKPAKLETTSETSVTIEKEMSKVKDSNDITGVEMKTPEKNENKPLQENKEDEKSKIDNKLAQIIKIDSNEALSKEENKKNMVKISQSKIKNEEKGSSSISTISKTEEVNKIKENIQVTTKDIPTTTESMTPANVNKQEHPKITTTTETPPKAEPSKKPISSTKKPEIVSSSTNKIFPAEENKLPVKKDQEKLTEDSPTPKVEEFKKKIQKVNIDDKELANERNNSWKLISTVSPPKANEIPKDKHKTDGQESSDNKDIVLEFSKENQGLEVTTKDLGEDIAQFTELCNELAFRYWQTMTEDIDKRRSFVLSPYSVTSMLAMMFMGARGATSGEMNEILKLDDMVTFNPHFTLKNISDSIETSSGSGVVTSAFVRELFSDKSKGKILTFYKERAQHFYNGHVEEINFKLISDIIRRRTNLLVKRYTWGRIVEYMKANTITMTPPLAAFSANIFQTDCSGSSVEGRDGEMYFVVSPNVRQRRLVPVPAVVYRNGFLAGYDPVLDATAAALGNTNSVISTLFLMPGQQGNIVHTEDLEALEKRLLDSNPTTPAWNRLLRTLLPRIGLELQIPRFSHKSIFNVSKTLKKMGLKELFDPDHADLGGLNGPSKDLYLSDMIQSTSFVTCGEGVIGEQHHIEEYPETLSGPQRRRTSRWASGWDEPRDYQRAFHDPHDVGDAMHLPLHLRPRQARLPARNAQPARLKFDRPFLYFVRHNPSGMILYVGRYNPRLLP